MDTIKLYQIERLNFPVNGHNYIVSMWQSIDGVNFAYCGYSKYFRTLGEAEAYKKEQEGTT